MTIETKFYTVYVAATGVFHGMHCSTRDTEVEDSVFYEPDNELGGYPWESGLSFVETSEVPDMGSCEWNTSTMGWRRSPQMAYIRQLEQANIYKELQQYSPVTILNVLPNDAELVADADKDSRTLIEGFARGAMSAIIAGTPELYSLSFTDAANQEVTVDAFQTVKIANAMLRHFTTCHGVYQAHRKAMLLAIDNGATAEDIEAYDYTVGYPSSTIDGSVG